ncbi:MAG: hypothetical protein FWD66_08055 [Paludibacter sp.]|nr:hypothetical protein [Paludibacter sp.]
MNNFTIFLTAIVPALLVLLTAWIVLQKLLKNFENERNKELRKANLQYITPVRLRAYERLMLLIERTNPKNLILNNFKEDMTCFDLQITLQNVIRQEFAHNLSQQIYVSSALWESISDTKESLLNLVNLCALKCPSDTNGVALAEGIIMIYNNEVQNPTDVSTELLKKEVIELF